MSRIAWWMTAVVGLGLAGSLALYRGLHDRTRADTVNPASASLIDARALPSEPHEDVERLRSELALMQGQVLGLRQAVAEQRPADTTATPAAAPEEPDPAAQQERRAESARRWREHMAEVAATFEQEALDRGFATSAQTTIERAIESQPALAAAAGKAECRSQTCRVEIRKDDGGQIDKQLPLFLRAVGAALPRAQADHIDGENSQKTMVLYLSAGNPAMEPRR